MKREKVYAKDIIREDDFLTALIEGEGVLAQDATRRFQAAPGTVAQTWQHPAGVTPDEPMGKGKAGRAWFRFQAIDKKMKEAKTEEEKKSLEKEWLKALHEMEYEAQPEEP